MVLRPCNSDLPAPLVTTFTNVINLAITSHIWAFITFSNLMGVPKEFSSKLSMKKVAYLEIISIYYDCISSDYFEVWILKMLKYINRCKYACIISFKDFINTSWQILWMDGWYGIINSWVTILVEPELQINWSMSFCQTDSSKK